ncbi:hypothetical protein [Pedobacter mucosus]|uniref:hypothetical protein n=1 Tax=Pedobacter mucosus TaxID=2895286 RepID=UPI001EE413D8|nr:hypothetical protein [Pedobacter mucosus]UKT63982.1 hypothetical protein LOK61_19720 [Pedobacter mucosus]
MSGSKYLLIFFIALTLMFKVSHVTSVIIFPNASQVEIDQEESEKEEKKTEIEICVNQTIQNYPIIFAYETEKPLVVREGFFHISYYPEVLTPPPSLII